MRFGVLGPLTVRSGDGVGTAGAGVSVRVPEAKVRALLAVLLTHEGRPVSADRLVDDLWGPEPPGKPANALQGKVSLLRRAIGRDRVVHGPAGYALDMTDAEIDADRFRELLARARSAATARTRADLLGEALGLWRGPAYADFRDEPFVRTAVRELEEQRLTALEEQARARLDLGEHLSLAGELAAPVARHPLRERLRLLQMRALYRAGRQGEALASYAELRELLATELGADPGPELGALHAAILRQDPSLDASPAPAPTGPALPTPLTTLVGRDDAVHEVGRLLSAARLVTLTGAGGVGKTRLALAAAGRLADTCASDFRDGVRLVELACLRTGGADDVAEAIASALGLRDDAATPAPKAPTALAAPPPSQGRPARGPYATADRPAAEDRLAAALRDRRTLLILDNCEHVVEPVARLAEHLLRAAPGLRVLATSQEPLGVSGESLHPVEPLRQADAIRLFTDRATAADPGFAAAGSGGEDAVAAVCRRLDGIPLALELAATRVRALGVRTLAARLDDRFRVLTAGRRGAPARQQTLRAVLDWSWELLTAPERVVLRRLAAHSDGCALEAAEAVCAGDGVAREEVLDLLARLVDRSLVVRVDGPAGPRYRLLESVAAYATERLHEMADFTAVRDRHLHYYLRLAEETEPRLRGPAQRARMALLTAETANLRTALTTATQDDRHPVEALRLVTALAWYWLLSGRLQEARRALSSALDAAERTSAGRPSTGPAPHPTAAHPTAAQPTPPHPTALRAEVRSLHAAFALLGGEPMTPGTPGAMERDHAAVESPQRRARARWLGAYGLFNAGALAAAETLNALALHDFEALDDRWGIAACLGRRAVHATVRGELAAVRADGERSARLFRELGDRWGESQSVMPLATLASINGDYAEAARVHHEGLRIAEELGLDTEVSTRLSGLGRLALLTREPDRARELHERARRIAAEQGYRFGEIHAEIGLALGARRTGDLDGARTRLVRIRDWYAEVSVEAGNALVLAELGFVAEQRGDAVTALATHLGGLTAARAVGDPRAVALALEGLSGADALAGRAGPAALLLGAATAARRTAGAPLPPAERTDVDRITHAARAALGPAAFEEVFAHGTALTPDEALTARAHGVAPAPESPR
ncbi:AfsR/SARP family transcriptional regulator [Streptomyces niveus]|uniref:AfsR/SARP family transcriptional regulator n=1 Tax=Streptomyces niveus TaxID=193462 RepID=UPI0009908236|nr:BTAD domain-containing putative transcriptional regulator [Streptomyces niveus]